MRSIDGGASRLTNASSGGSSRLLGGPADVANVFLRVGQMGGTDEKCRAGSLSSQFYAAAPLSRLVPVGQGVGQSAGGLVRV